MVPEYSFIKPLKFNLLAKMKIGSLLIAFIVYAQLSGLCAKEKGNNQPNIIFILTDDQRWDAIGYSGNEIIYTPEMDKLANQGVYFHNAFVTTPICAVSRASIFTGLHERTHRYTFQTGPIREEHMQDSYPRMLQKAGYYTGFFGKFGVAYPHISKLFDVSENYDRKTKYKDYRGYYYKTLDGDTVHLTRYTGQKALDFIDSLPSEKPFCLSLSFSAPHAHDGAPKQYFWQESVDHLYRDVDIPEAPISDDKYFEALPARVKEGFNRERWTWRYDTQKKYQESVKAYYRMISGVDLEIGKIRKKLKEKGLDKNTVIIFMGDNGYFLGERQLAGKWLMYENCLRVPLIICDPRIKIHRDIEQLALNIDIPSTILDLAGMEAPELWQGSSLLELARGRQTTSLRDTILTEHLWNFEHIPPSEAVRTDEYKYLRYINDKSIEELYNLKTDPLEVNNLVEKEAYKNQLNELRKKCDQLKSKYADKILGVPTGLMVEQISNPDGVKVNNTLPEYNWIIPIGAGSQQSYQVLVASDKELIDNNIGDMWNSGEVKNNMPQASHLGTKLEARNTYYWKVRIWDSGHRLSEYSKAQKFTIGSFSGKNSTEN